MVRTHICGQPLQNKMCGQFDLIASCLWTTSEKQYVWTIPLNCRLPRSILRLPDNCNELKVINWNHPKSIEQTIPIFPILNWCLSRAIPQIQVKKYVTEILLRRSCYGDSVTETPTHFFVRHAGLSGITRQIIVCGISCLSRPSTAPTAYFFRRLRLPMTQQSVFPR